MAWRPGPEDHQLQTVIPKQLNRRVAVAAAAQGITKRAAVAAALTAWVERVEAENAGEAP